MVLHRGFWWHKLKTACASINTGAVKLLLIVYMVEFYAILKMETVNGVHTCTQMLMWREHL